LLLAWIAVSYWLRGVGPSATIVGVTVIVSVFVIVLQHELTHALMARRFGVRTRDILLLPIGGIRRMIRSRIASTLALVGTGNISNRSPAPSSANTPSGTTRWK
jgi:hypothetical protein